MSFLTSSAVDANKIACLSVFSKSESSLSEDEEDSTSSPFLIFSSLIFFNSYFFLSFAN